MKTLKVTLIAAVAALALGHAPADAGKSDGHAKAKKDPLASVAGSYSGALSGTISVGGEMVVVPKNIAIVDTRGHKLEPGASVSGRSLYVTGRVREGKLVAGFIVVSDAEAKADFSQETLPGAEADPDRAR